MWQKELPRSMRWRRALSTVKHQVRQAYSRAQSKKLPTFRVPGADTWARWRPLQKEQTSWASPSPGRLLNTMALNIAMNCSKNRACAAAKQLSVLRKGGFLNDPDSAFLRCPTTRAMFRTLVVTGATAVYLVGHRAPAPARVPPGETEEGTRARAATWPQAPAPSTTAPDRPCGHWAGATRPWQGHVQILSHFSATVWQTPSPLTNVLSLT